MNNLFDIALKDVVVNGEDKTFVFSIDFNDEEYEVNFQYEGKLSCINESGGDIKDSGLMEAIEGQGINYSDAVDYLNEIAADLV